MIIGIAGGTGSGKTTVARKLLESFPEGVIYLISQDSYYKRAPEGVPLSELKKMNYDHPDAFDWALFADHIEALKNGQAVEQPTYSVLTCDRGEETIRVAPSEVIVVEGILALHDERLRALMDLKIYVDAEPDERLIRLIDRDVVERGRTPRIVVERYQKTLKPMHAQFIEPTKAYADVIVPQGGENARAIDMLRVFISRFLSIPH